MADEKVPTLSGEVAAAIRRALGTIPEDLLGIALGDWIAEKRKVNQARLKENTKKILADRGIDPDQKAASPLMFIAICEAASDEDRPELQDLWSRLLAAAVDKTRARQVRSKFIEIVRQMEPMDALVLMKLASETAKQPVRDRIMDQLKSSMDEVTVSLINLAQLGLASGQFNNSVETGFAFPTATGRELLRVLS